MFDQVYIEDYQFYGTKWVFYQNICHDESIDFMAGVTYKRASASVAERRVAARAPHKALVAPVS